MDPRRLQLYTSSALEKTLKQCITRRSFQSRLMLTLVCVLVRQTIACIRAHVSPIKIDDDAPVVNLLLIREAASVFRRSRLLLSRLRLLFCALPQPVTVMHSSLAPGAPGAMYRPGEVWWLQLQRKKTSL